MQPIEFTYSEEMIINAQRDMWRGMATWTSYLKMVVWISLICSILILAADFGENNKLSWSDSLSGISIATAIAMGYALLMFGCGYLANLSAARKSFQQLKSLQLKHYVHWNTETLTIECATSISKLPWGMYIAWQEGKSCLLFYQSDRLINLVSKSALSVDQQREIIQFLIAAKVPEKPAFGLIRSSLAAN